jgi:hypothetical protein
VYVRARASARGESPNNFWMERDMTPDTYVAVEMLNAVFSLRSVPKILIM